MSGAEKSLKHGARLLRLVALVLLGSAVLLGLLAFAKTHKTYHIATMVLWATLFLVAYKMRV
uniref:Uncharacterized protein n=1 Tax=Fervidicoccus fontis TaxID=683846 RepID=A0A7J3ZLR8_9CREN